MGPIAQIPEVNQEFTGPLPGGIHAFSPNPSGQNRFDDVPVDVGQAEVAALGTEGELLVVEAEAVHQGGLEVMDVDGIFHDVISQIIGGPVDGAGLDAAAGHPHGVERDVANSLSYSMIRFSLES